MSLTNEHGIGREEGLANDLPRMSANQAVTLPGCDFWKGVNWEKVGFSFGRDQIGFGFEPLARVFMLASDQSRACSRTVWNDTPPLD